MKGVNVGKRVFEGKGVRIFAGVFEGEILTEDEIVVVGNTDLSTVSVGLKTGVFVKMIFLVGTGVFVENKGLITPVVSSGAGVPAELIIFSGDSVAVGLPVGEGNSVFEIITDS
ncbi:MAG: hypothetical protein AB9907_09980 [Flexilinea sp.]